MFPSFASANTALSWSLAEERSKDSYTVLKMIGLLSNLGIILSQILRSKQNPDGSCFWYRKTEQFIIYFYKCIQYLLLAEPLQSNQQNCEHLKYFRNVYCVMANRSKDQARRARHKTTN